MTAVCRDGGIDLAQEGGGDLHEGRAALVSGGGEACGVADDAAAEGDEGGAAFGVAAQEFVVDAVERFDVFVRFAVGGG